MRHFNLRYRYKNPEDKLHSGWFYTFISDYSQTDLQLKAQEMEEEGWIVEIGHWEDI